MAKYTDIRESQDENMKFINEMLDYKQKIVDALKDPANHPDRMFKNDDRSKNAMIMSAMLDHCNEVIMYCGKMSVFRNGFYEEIENSHKGAGEKAREEMSNSLSTFFANKNKLTIILEDFNKNYLDDLISDDIKKPELVTIKVIDKDRLVSSVLSHTAIGKKDNKVVIKRREINSRDYHARCVVNLNEEIAEDSMTLMSYIEEDSIDIDR